MELWDRLIHKDSRGTVERLAKIFKAAGISKADLEDLEFRFTPYTSFNQYDPLDIWAMMGYLADGAFSIEKLDPFSISPNARIDRMWVHAKANESGHHIYLKRLATRWLKRRKKVKEVEYEQDYPGGRCDVCSKDQSWIVECGCSRPSKVWDTFYNPNFAKKRLVLFNQDNITVFSSGPKIDEYRKMASCRRICIDAPAAMEGFGRLVIGDSTGNPVNPAPEANH